MRRPLGTVLSALLTLAACSGAEVVSPTSGSTIQVPPSTPTSTLPPVVDCPGAGEFGEGGAIATIDGEGSDSGRLGRVSWDANAQCESFDFQFETSEGAPATSVPEIRIDHLESFQVIRIAMGVSAAVLTDQLVETELVDRLYVVRSLDGGMFVDLHLKAPAAARARVEASPAHLTVDLRPGFVPFTGESAVGGNTVVVSPAAGTAVDPLSQVTGYARTPEDQVTIIVTQGDTVLSELATTSADSSQTWGEFRQELSLSPGVVSVFVGESSDGTGLEGVTLDLTVG